MRTELLEVGANMMLEALPIFVCIQLGRRQPLIKVRQKRGQRIDVGDGQFLAFKKLVEGLPSWQPPHFHNPIDRLSLSADSDLACTIRCDWQYVEVDVG